MAHQFQEITQNSRFVLTSAVGIAPQIFSPFFHHHLLLHLITITMALFNGYTNKSVLDRYLRLGQQNKVRGQAPNRATWQALLSPGRDSHILMFSYCHIFLLLYSCILIFSYSHILIFSYSHILIFSYSHILLFSYSHILLFSYSHNIKFSPSQFFLKKLTV